MFIKVKAERIENPYAKKEDDRLTEFTDVIDVKDSTLLDYDNFPYVPKYIRQYSKKWWLNIPDNFSSDTEGYVNEYGDFIRADVVSQSYTVRPSLIIDMSNSKELDVGDVFTFGDKRFYVVSDVLAFCLSDIGESCFSVSDKGKVVKDYEKSDIKKVVDKWFLHSLDECIQHSIIHKQSVYHNIVFDIRDANNQMCDEVYAELLRDIISFAEIKLAETNKRILT